MKSLTRSVLAIGALASFAFLLQSSSCIRPEKCVTCDSVEFQTPLAKMSLYVDRTAIKAYNAMVGMDLVAEGSMNKDSLQNWWRRARAHYEPIRFAVEEFAPVLHRDIARWLGDSTFKGFHFLEPKIFAPSVTKDAIYLPLEVLMVNLQIIPSTLKNAGMRDEGVFHGLKLMIADIETYKLSEQDSAYSNNSYVDIFSNLEGLDSVYACYQTTVADSAPSVDSLFHARIAAMRATLTAAGSIRALDKSSFRAQHLAGMRDVLDSVAKVYNITIP